MLALRRLGSLSLCAALSGACGSYTVDGLPWPSKTSDAGVQDDLPAELDAGADATVRDDAGEPVDTDTGTGAGGGTGTAGGGADAGSADGGADAGTAGGGADAGSADGGADAGTPDAGADAGNVDAGSDAGTADAGSDAGPGDAGTDAGPADAGVDAGNVACGGRTLFGVCWYLGAAGASCNETCMRNGGFDTRALSCVGTTLQGGSIEECTQIFRALGITDTVGKGTRSDGNGFGCHLWTDGAPWWLDDPGAQFGPLEQGPGVRLACGCQR